MMNNDHKKRLVEAADICLSFGYEDEYYALIKVVVDDEMKQAHERGKLFSHADVMDQFGYSKADLDEAED